MVARARLIVAVPFAGDESETLTPESFNVYRALAPRSIGTVTASVVCAATNALRRCYAKI